MAKQKTERGGTRTYIVLYSICHHGKLQGPRSIVEMTDEEAIGLLANHYIAAVDPAEFPAPAGLHPMGRQ